MSTLVTYFSASGVTAKVAGKLAKAAGAELVEGGILNGIVTEKKLKEVVD